jgi:hypothetical protein
MKINKNESSHGEEVNINPILEMSASKKNGQVSEGKDAKSAAEPANTFSIKVLCKEKSYQITGVNGDTKISEIKRRAEALTDVPAHRQRLIMTGKLLKPDDKTLTFFKIGPDASVHLFPIPEATAMPVQTSAVTAVDPRGAGGLYLHPLNSGPQQQMGQAIPALPMHPDTVRQVYDASLEQTVREVRLWCFILLSLSAIELFNNFSIFSVTGKLGTNAVDTIFLVFDTCCSIAGIWVASMGMKSARTLDAADIRKYVQWLGILAVGCVLLRVLWVADVVVKVKEEVKYANDHPGETTTDEYSAGGDTTEHPHYDNQTVVAIGVQVVPFSLFSNSPLISCFFVVDHLQAAMIAIVIIGAWFSCFRRALRLHIAVSLRPENSTTATTAEGE